MNFSDGWIKVSINPWFVGSNLQIIQEKKFPPKALELVQQSMKTALLLGWDLEVRLNETRMHPTFLPKKRYSVNQAVKELREELREKEDDEVNYWEPKEEYLEKWEREPYEKVEPAHRLEISIRPYQNFTLNEFFNIKKILDKENKKLLKILNKKRFVNHYPEETLDGIISIVYPEERKDIFQNEFKKYKKFNIK